jgi:hypothetical protein
MSTPMAIPKDHEADDRAELLVSATWEAGAFYRAVKAHYESEQAQSALEDWFNEFEQIE